MILDDDNKVIDEQKYLRALRDSFNEWRALVYNWNYKNNHDWLFQFLVPVNNTFRGEKLYEVGHIVVPNFGDCDKEFEYVIDSLLYKKKLPCSIHNIKPMDINSSYKEY